MNSSNRLKTGGDPRMLPDYASLREELAKLSHPARPDVDWKHVEQLSLSLFRQNGVELHTAIWYTLARTHLAGIVGLNEGLALLEALLTHQWGALWPQPIPARLKSLAEFSQRLQALLRKLSLQHADLPHIYQAEQHLSAIHQLLQRLNLKNISQTGELCVFMRNAAVRLESKGIGEDNGKGINESSDGDAGLLSLTIAPVEPLIYVVREEAPVTPEAPIKMKAGRPWKSFAAGMLTMLIAGAAGWWGWQQQQASEPVPVTATESSLTELEQLAPLWRQRYGFALAAGAKPQQATGLKAQWQHYIEGNALPAETLSGWHQGMEGLQDLARRLNALDERRGKYLTASELKSMVFTVTQHFSRAVPLEERLYQLNQTAQGAKPPAALLQQTDMHINQLLNRYALILQQSESL
ncbi:VasL domain-containing protein [Kalamiella sp. sgz302252]|uniref:VasL domain-containing protein n=1 Tax=Pantoea sp. sgz302252 TaxID=3341827 RepID=UPI0036D3DFCF